MSRSSWPPESDRGSTPLISVLALSEITSSAETHRPEALQVRPSASRVYPLWQWQRKEPLSLKQCWLQTPRGWHSSMSSHVFESLLSWKPIGHVHWAPNGPWMQPWVQPALLSEQLSWSVRKQKSPYEWKWKEKHAWRHKVFWEHAENNH